MAHHSPSIPVELVALIFEHIDDAPTLLACLALSHSLQRYAEQALYADISFVLSLSHPSTAQLRSHADEKDDGETRRWSRGTSRIHGARALSGFRTAITRKPHLTKLTTHLTVHILSPFGRSTPFYLDLNEILPTLTNLQHLDMRYTAPPSSPQPQLPPLSLWTLTPPELIFSLSPSLHRARSQRERADFRALASASAAPTALKTVVLRGVCVPWEFVRRQRALECLELSGRMLDVMRADESGSASNLGTSGVPGGVWHDSLKALRLPHLPAAPAAQPNPTTPTTPDTHPDALTALFSLPQKVYTPARLGLDDAQWDAERGYKGCWNLDGPRVETGMMTWVRTS